MVHPGRMVTVRDPGKADGSLLVMLMPTETESGCPWAPRKEWQKVKRYRLEGKTGVLMEN